MSMKMASGRERLTYFNGQALLKQDLRDDVAYESWLRGLHVRALHDTWGVALGMAVSIDRERKLLLIEAGIAYDCQGREIVLNDTIGVPLPPPPAASQTNFHVWWFDLAIGYDSSLSEMQPGCRPPTGRNAERPLLRWHFAGDGNDPLSANVAESLRYGAEIPLARISLTAKGTFSNPVFTTRKNAQGIVRPHIASGGGQQSFEWDSQTGAFSTYISTYTGGFSTTPFYFVNFTQNPVIPLIESLTDNIEDVTPLLGAVLGPFLSVRSPGVWGFYLDVRFGLPQRQTGMTTTLASAVALPGFNFDDGFTLDFEPQWVGIEPVGGCTPPFTPLAVIYVYDYDPVIWSWIG